MNSFIDKISDYASRKIPFIFIIDFEQKKPLIYTLNEAASKGVFYQIKSESNFDFSIKTKVPIDLKLVPKVVSKDFFSKKILSVISEIKKGESYLLNLTFPSKIDLNISLMDVFAVAKAPYKLLVDNQFVVFSPESFIQIKNNKVYTYPMKGTIDASIKDAQEKLINNPKEEWEHNTIVDLLRNDLSLISQNVKVTKYRYVEKIKTYSNEILQSSSEIVGDLDCDWRENLGELLVKLLPAGSISGAPKKRTLEIIAENEISKRGYYTGIFGVFDGEKLDSAVNIRYIEKNESELVYRSGGGITANSNVDDEYLELKQKIYVPTI